MARLEEAVTLMRRLWTESSTTLHGRFYRVTDSPMVSPDALRPRILIGGGGRHMMHLAGRVADTVSMIPKQTTGEWSVPDSVPDSAMSRMREKAAWVAEGAVQAGRDPDDVELSTMVAKTIVGEHPNAAIAQEAVTSGLTPVELLGDPLPVRNGGGGVRPASSLAGRDRYLVHLALRSGRRAVFLPGRARAPRPARLSGVTT